MSTKQTHSLTTCSLYNFIYTSFLAKSAVFVILAVIFLQPFAPLSAQAFEEATEAAIDLPVEEVIQEKTNSTIKEVTPSVVSAESIEVDTPVVENAEDGSGNESDESDTTTDDETTGEEDIEVAHENTEVDEEFASDEGTEEPSIDEQLATTTTDYPVYNVTQGDATFYQFDRNSCVTVGDGSFYCSEAEANKPKVATDRFFAATDSSGDLEIFASIDGEYLQITQNEFEDASPFYDAISDTLVWHRLIDDRYQIVSYDISSGKETILTNDPVNNMEPTRFGDITVWQRWVTNNWEIVMYDGTQTVQLTTNIYNDIAPSIRGDYVMWRTLVDTAQVVTVYDVLTKLTTVIEGEDASNVVSNPRMVMVFDSVTKNGEVVTKGYDPITGMIVPLSAIPVSLPTEIPESDQTGETRALLQNKLQTPGKELLESDTDSDDGFNTDTEGAASSSDDFTLDLSVATTSVDVPEYDEFTLLIGTLTVTPPIDETTLIIEPVHTSESQVADTADVVIPLTE